MEIKIGVQNVMRELIVETDQDGAEVEKAVAAAVADASGVLTLTDNKGRKIIVPTAKLAFVELGSPAVGQVGFRS